MTPELKKQALSLLQRALNNPTADFRDGSMGCHRSPHPSASATTRRSAHRLGQKSSLFSSYSFITRTRCPWEGMSGAVFLVDDMVDSRWTFTVIAALLRRAGSGAVFPLALALNSLGTEA